MGFLDNMKDRLGFGDDDYDEFEYEDEQFDDRAAKIVVHPRDERREERGAAVSRDEVSPWGTSPSAASSSVRLTSRPGYAGYQGEVDDFSENPVASRQSRGVITGRGPVTGSGPVAQPTPQVSMHFLEPRSFTEAEVVGDRFKRGQTVILNMVGTRPELAKRILDFASGLTFALDGSIQKVADKVFILTPRNVQISDADKRRLRDVGMFKDED